MRTSLDRSLWRYRAGRYPEEVLRKQFDDEIGRLVTEFAVHQGDIPVLRERVPTLIPAFDTAIDETKRFLAMRLYKQSLRFIKDARILLKRTREALQTIKECAIAERAYDDLQMLAQSERLNALTTMKIINQLVSESNKLLDEGKYQQARFIARMCQRDIKALQSQNRADARKAKHLTVKIDQLKVLCTQARWWETGTAFSLRTDRAFGVLNSLLDDARLTLVERLLNDLELEFAPTKAFLTEYERYQSGFEKRIESDSVSTEVLRQLICRESWEAGTEYLLTNELGMLEKRVKSIQPKIRHFFEEVASENSTDDSEAPTESEPKSSAESEKKV